MSIDGAIPIKEIDLLFKKSPCMGTDLCTKYTEQFKRRMIGRYVGEGEPFKGQLSSAILDVESFNRDVYFEQVRSIHKGAALRQSRKSDRAGLLADRFVWKNHIPDIVDINTSMSSRSGGSMSKAYNRTVEEMGGAPTKLKTLKEPDCYAHCIWDWGIFEEHEGYKQGEVVTNRKLVAYIRLKRQGNLGIYTTILGHGDYLKFGVMYKLHFHIMDWLAETGESNLPSLKYILYGAADSGNEGLRMWKKRCLFNPAYLVIKD